MVGHKTGNTIERTLPVYPYPLVTRYNGSGSATDWRSFHAVDPATGAGFAAF